MQTRSSDENSVYLSVKRVDCDKTEEQSVQICIPCDRSFSLVFWEEEWLVGAATSTWNFGSTGPRWSEIADFEQIIARSASAVTPSDISSININKKSPTPFPMSLRWSSYVAPKSPKGGSKTQSGRLPSKIAFQIKSIKSNLFETSCNTNKQTIVRKKNVSTGHKGRINLH